MDLATTIAPAAVSSDGAANAIETLSVLNAPQHLQDILDQTPPTLSHELRFIDGSRDLPGQQPLSNWSKAKLDQAINQIREATEDAIEPTKRAILLHNAGKLLLGRFLRTGSVFDIEEATHTERQAVTAAPHDCEAKGLLLSNLAHALNVKFAALGATADLEESITVAKQAVSHSTAQDDDSHQLISLRVLGNSLVDRYTRTPASMTNLEDLIQVRRAALGIATRHLDDRGARPYLFGLANALLEKYMRSSEVGDLNEALEYGKQASAPNFDDDSMGHAELQIMGSLLHELFLAKGDILHLDESIKLGRRAVAAAAGTLKDSDKVDALLSVETRLRERYARLGTIDDLDEAIKIANQAVAAAPDLSPSKATCLTNLGMGLGLRWARFGSTSDLDEAVRISIEAVNILPDNHPDKPTTLNNLGRHLHSRWDKLGKKADLDEAIQVARQAVSTTPDDHPDWARNLNNLGIGLSARYGETGNLDDIGEAIDIQRQVVSKTPTTDHERPQRLESLGRTLRRRFERTQQSDDIEEAISTLRESIAATPDGHPNLGSELYYLGMSIHERYFSTGSPNDIQEAVRFFRDAVSSTPSDHRALMTRLSGLGVGLQSLYQVIGAEADLEEAIQISQRILAGCQEGDKEKVIRLGNLGTALAEKYERTENLEDLDGAIRYTRKAISIASKAEQQASLRSNLAQMLAMKFERLEQLHDLDESVELTRTAIDAFPNNPHISRVYSNLGAQLRYRYEKTGSPSDIEEAVAYVTKMLDHLSENDPEGGRMLVTHGFTLHEAYKETGDQNLLESALNSFHRALGNVNFPLMDRLPAGGAILRVSPDWEESYEAAAQAVSLVPKLASRTLRYSDRQHTLSQVAGITSEAAMAALVSGQEAHVALSILEQGRGILASTLEEIRTDLFDLKESHPDLAQRFEDLRIEMEVPSISKIEATENPADQAAETPRHAIDVDQRFDDLVSAIRQKTGFEHFLAPLNREDMLTASSFGPVVIINITPYQCDAILVQPNDIRAMTLACSKDEIQKKLIDNPRGLRTLEWLWDVIAGPILDALGFTGPPVDGNWPRIWWIPTGLLSRVPIHAAGYHGDGSRAVMDRVMSSYISSIKTLLHGRRRQVMSLESAKALLVGMTKEHTIPLPFVQEEIRAVRGVCDSLKIQPVEVHGNKQDVLRHLPECIIFHFAGHGYSDVANPLESHLQLGKQGDLVRVVDLLEVNRGKGSPFLAYLSACSTGRIEEDKFADESVHLISACQLAGFRHAIGTLWEVADASCSEMARLTYDALQEGGLTDESVCRALHDAIRALREQWLSKRSKAPTAGERSVEESQSDEELMFSPAPMRGIVDESDESSRNAKVRKRRREAEESQLSWVPYVHFGV